MLSSEVSVILIKQLGEGSLGTVNAYDPVEAGILARISIQFPPLLVEYSSLTLSIPLNSQVMFLEVFAVHDSPPLGEVRVTVGAQDHTGQESIDELLVIWIWFEPSAFII